MNSVIDSIADICPLTKPSIDGLQTELDNVRGDVRAYKDKIDNYEYTKYTQTNGELQGLIDALDNTIKSFLETGENLATYQAGTISQNTELINLSEQVYAAGQYMLDNQAEIDAAIEQQTSIYAEIQAEQDRIFEEECQLRQEEGAMQILDGAIQVGLAIAVTLGTGCTTLPATIAVGIAGGTMMVCGAGNLTQGSMNVYYGSIGDLTSIAVNPVCEVFFGGNEKNFDTFCYYNMMFLTMYMMAGAGSVSGMVVEAVQEGAGDIASTYVTSYLSSTCNLSNFESVLIGTTASFLIDPGLDAIGSHSFGSGTHFSHLNNYTDIAPNVNPHLHVNQLDWDTNIHILNDATDIPPNTLIDGVELPNHLCSDGVGVGSEGGLELVKFNIDEIRPKLKTEPDTAFFWSGKTDGVGGAEVAADIAKGKGGVTLESTIEEKDITMPEWDFNVPSSMDAWDMASAAYAEQVSGEVRAVVGTELRPDNIWENVELPRLMENPNVTKITIIDPKTGIETVIFER